MYAEDVVFKIQKFIFIMRMTSKLKDLIDLRPDICVPAKTQHFCNIWKLIFRPSIQFRGPIGNVKRIACPYPIRKCCIY